MKTILPFLCALFLSPLASGQAADTGKAKRGTFNTYDELRAKQAQAGIGPLTYVDSTFNFQVLVPEWLHLFHTGSAYAWGGTLPAVDGIENAIVIKSFDKASFKSFADFRYYVVEGLAIGHKPPWSDTHTFVLKNDLGRYKSIGNAYKVYLLRRGLMYHCEYVLAETKTAYLWIDFTATEETFDKNGGKFDEFMKGFRIKSFER